MSTFDNWHTHDGIQIFSAPKLRQPHIELHERDGLMRVVMLADYEALARQFEESLVLLEQAREDSAMQRRARAG